MQTQSHLGYSYDIPSRSYTMRCNCLLVRIHRQLFPNVTSCRQMVLTDMQTWAYSNNNGAAAFSEVTIQMGGGGINGIVAQCRDVQSVNICIRWDMWGMLLLCARKIAILCRPKLYLYTFGSHSYLTSRVSLGEISERCMGQPSQVGCIESLSKIARNAIYDTPIVPAMPSFKKTCSPGSLFLSQLEHMRFLFEFSRKRKWYIYVHVISILECNKEIWAGSFIFPVLCRDFSQHSKMSRKF